MVISPISVQNTSYIVKIGTADKSKENAKPVNNAEKADSGAYSSAITSYFRGGQQVSFKGFYCETSDFVTKSLHDVPCCCCGGKMIISRNIGRKAKDFSSLKGESLADKIENNQEYFRTTERMIANLAADKARQNPRMGLANAVQSLEPNLKDLTIDYCVKNLNKADEIAQKATGNKENPISVLIGKEIEKIREGEIERVDFTEKLSLCKGIAGDEDYIKIQEQVLNIPENYSNVSARYSEIYSDNSQDTAKELLRPSMQTIEHIHPKSQGGPNASQNYIAECYQCNHPRGHMPYSEWLKIHPEYPINAQKHIEYFQQQQIDGIIPEEYDTYPVEVKETLSNESNGRMKLRVLNPQKIAELREAKQKGKEINVHEEIEKSEETDEKTT